MRLMFENSTVCHLVDELILCALSMVDGLSLCFGGGLFVVVWVLMILAFCQGLFVRFVFCRFSMESLILAQDERWRRA